MGAVTAEEIRPLPMDDVAARVVVVVGAGPVGMRVLRVLRELDPDVEIVLYGDEAWRPYDRARLSGVLSGEVPAHAIESALEAEAEGTLDARFDCRVVEIDRECKTVTDALGRVQKYDSLVLATGSRPYVPALPGIELPGVYTFRDLSDVQKLIARRARSKRVVVLGGGLLGIEAARAMQRFNTHVSLVDHNAHVMFRQLDAAAGALLGRRLASLGVELYSKQSIRMVQGTTGVEGVVLQSGAEIACDTLIVATGIRSNVELAVRAGVAYRRGIRVDSGMRTSDPDIYAVGECCEVDGEVFGLVAPGLEQAAIAARRISGEAGDYRSRTLAVSLKVTGESVFSMGEPDIDITQGDTYVHADGDVYRRINVLRGHPIGVVAIGDWPELVRLRELANRGRRLAPWTLRRFERTGVLWPQDDAGVVSWPATAIVCSCNAVSKGAIAECIAHGCATVEDIGARTCAGTTCGSCQGSLREMLDADGQEERRPNRRALTFLSGLTLVGAVVASSGAPLTYVHTVQEIWRYDLLWRDPFWKQATGFALAGIALLGAALSLRRRTPLRLGTFDAWRLVHVVLGLGAIGALWAHTGFRLGDNLNQVLMATFALLLLTGAVFGLFVGREPSMPRTVALRGRTLGLRMHLLFLVPLPALIGIHVLKTYFF